jgi:DNA-binding GntR family transcriptional regulator
MSVLPGARTRAEAVAARLRSQILDGELAGGTRLRQNEVARDLGVSTTPVREAFAVLVNEGLLNGDPHRGVAVADSSVDDLVENYEMRIALESLAAEKAALNATPEDIIELQGLLDEMHRPPAGPATDDEDYYVRLNARFHARIYEIAHRPRLFALIESLREQAAIYIRIYTHTSSSAAATETQHTEIVEAIRRRAPKRAAKAVRDHLEFNLEFLLMQIGQPRPHERAA